MAHKQVAVRPWPVIRLTYAADGNFTISTADGGQRTVTVPEGLPRPQAAADAAADECLELGLERCRVQGYTDDGTVHELVVDAATGELEANEGAPSAPVSAGGRGWAVSRRAKQILVGAVAVVCIGATVSVVALAPDERSSPATAASPAPEPPPAQLPVLAPAGWGTYAAWAVPAQTDAPAPVVGPASNLVVATADGLKALDPQTGALQWERNTGGQYLSGMAVTTVGGRQVLATVTGQGTVTLRSGSGNRLDRFELDPAAEVTFHGASPLIVLPGQRAQVIVNGRLQRRLVPAGAEAVAASGATVTAVDGETGRLWRVSTSSADLPEPVQLQAPEGTGTATVAGAVASHLVTVWEPDNDKQDQDEADSDRVVVTVDALDSGGPSRVLAEPVPADAVDTSTLDTDPATGQALTGRVYLDVSGPSLTVVEHGGGELGGGYLFTSGSESGLRYAPGGGEPVPSPDEAPVPEVVLDSGKAVVREVAGADTPTVYALVPSSKEQEKP